ncbi:hypothetical protein [Halobacillus halophilus]|uniref:hypothetical protein n=1 Tax=Halobacillus halophilus TaxID=1570 RepID=UPI001CD532C9|nr:hypothetical protein [Halobacillus halophilus]MCA1012175.1 hypothetical protein [Halobacillus halophilus]
MGCVNTCPYLVCICEAYVVAGVCFFAVIQVNSLFNINKRIQGGTYEMETTVIRKEWNEDWKESG